mmetsp:Transcript_539/g.938  ORF Transcript_539/g.938 Transcript_539/m.938 type:complete len:201 (-) Transcript_539:151-753(-)
MCSSDYGMVDDLNHDFCVAIMCYIVDDLKHDFSLLNQGYVNGIVHFADDKFFQICHILLLQLCCLIITNGLLYHSDGNLLRDGADIANVWEDFTLRKLFFRYEVGKGFSSDIKHAIGNFFGSTNSRSKSQTREYKHIVALGRIKYFSIIHFHGVKWTARCKYALAICPIKSLFRSTFCFRRGVGERENNRTLTMLRHFSN